MKKCSYCGKEYPDDVAVCPLDGRPVVTLAGTVPPPLPTGPNQYQKTSNGLAIASLIMGICSFGCGPVLGIPAVICGHIGLSQMRQKPDQYGGSGMAIAGLVTGYIGIFVMGIAFMAGLLLPALARAKAKAQQINCVMNLKQVGLATRMWADDHKGTLPDSLFDMTNELSDPNLLICPSDPNHTRLDKELAVWDPNNISYVFLTPGMELEKLSHVVIVRCPIHGNELMGDGSVIQGKNQRSTGSTTSGVPGRSRNPITPRRISPGNQTN